MLCGSRSWELPSLLNMFEPVKMLCSLCVVFWWNVTRLEFCTFKRSWKLLTGFSNCHYDLSVTWSLKYNIEGRAKQNFDYTTNMMELRQVGEDVVGEWLAVDAVKRRNRRLWSLDDDAIVGIVRRTWWKKNG